MSDTGSRVGVVVARLHEHLKIVAGLEADGIAVALGGVASMITRAFRSGGKLLLVGNGEVPPTRSTSRPNSSVDTDASGPRCPPSH